jgi:hypothetical protein
MALTYQGSEVWMQNQSSQEALSSALKALRLVGKTGDSWDNHAVAQNILHEELGQFPATLQGEYDLDEVVRDRLLAHGRQDTAHALANTISLLRRIQNLERLVSLFGAITLSLLVVIAWKLWH